MVAVHDVLRRDALFLRFDGDGHSVFVRTADEYHFFSFLPQITDVDVRRHIDARQMPDVYRSVGIRQGCRNQIPFEFCHNSSIFVSLQN
jgi:hypothetical protein